MRKIGLKTPQAIILVAGLLLTTGIFSWNIFASAHADNNTVVLNHGGTIVTGRTTHYTAYDTGKPGFNIDWPKSSYPTVHEQVGGTGTFADPITVAINSKFGPNGDVPDGPYQIGEKFYIPRLHLYFVAEDSCNVDIDYQDCNGGLDKDDGTQLHMDLFTGGSQDVQGMRDCAFAYGGDTQVIANAGDGYPLPDQYPNGTTLFSNGQCIGSQLWQQYSDVTISNDSSTNDPGNVQGSPTPDTTPVVHLDDGNAIPLIHGGTIATGRTTHYTAYDTGKPGFNIDWPKSSYPTVHEQVGGTGTFADPITVAINSKNGPNGDVPDGPYQIGEKFYIPRLHLYFVAEDSCNVDIDYQDCNGGLDKDDGTQLHMDLFTGGSQDVQGMRDCAFAYGGDTQVIANAGDGYPLPDQYPNGTTLFSNGQCIGAQLWQQYQDVTISTGTIFATKPSGRIVSTSATPPAVVNLLSNNGTGSVANDPAWSSVWSDNFSEGSVDTTKWTIRNYAAGQWNNEQECYKDDGVHTRVDGTGQDSHLVIQADKQGGDCPYISGRLDTEGKYYVQPPTDPNKPVRVEASIQLPQGGNGTWPAFWMLGKNIDSVGWPDCGELDIFENAGLRSMPNDTIQSTVHGLGNATQDERYTLPSGNFSDGYHVFALDWYTDHMVFSVDGQSYKTIDTNSLGGDQVFNQPYFILLNFAVGGDWPGSPDASTPFPQQMNVKYVSVYQHV